MWSRPAARSSPSSIRCSAALFSWALPPSWLRPGCTAYCTGSMPTNRTNRAWWRSRSVENELDVRDAIRLVEMDINGVIVERAYDRPDIVAEKMFKLFRRRLLAVEGVAIVGAQQSENLVAGWTGLQQLTLQIQCHSAPRVVDVASMRIGEPNGSIKRSRRPGAVVGRWRVQGHASQQCRYDYDQQKPAEHHAEGSPA